jgi:hypothetical protein
MKVRTFEGWKLLGYYVRKGEKATGRDKNDKPTFTREQVDDQEDFAMEPRQVSAEYRE